MSVTLDGTISTTEELLDQVKHVAGVVDSFFNQPLPDACEALIYRCDLANQNRTYLSGFERYAARALRSVHAEDVRPVLSKHDIGVGRLAATGLMWLSFDPDLLKPEEQRIVLGVESVVNRLILLTKLATTAEDICAFSANDGESYCMERDWAVVSGFGNQVEAFQGAMAQDNPLQTLFGVSAPKGGEWDTRTRFARNMESIVAPYRMSYSFDCQVSRGVFEIHVNTITPDVMPCRRVDGTLKQWTSSSAEGNRLMLAYALRLSAFVAGAAFFSNIAITDVVVTAHRGILSGDPVSSLHFSRMPYLIHVVPSMKMGDLRSDDHVFDPLATARVLNPDDARFGMGNDGIATVVEPYQIDFDERRIPTWRDERPIPEDLRMLLHADTVSDLDVSHIEDDDLAASVREAVIDMNEFPMASMATFEGILEAHQEDRTAHSLFCVDECARVLMGLSDSTDTRYDKYPDALYVSTQKRSVLYQQLDDAEAALIFAKECLELAPTTPSAYLEVANMYIALGQPGEAVRMLELGLCFAVDPATCRYAYYRLAYALWLDGKVDESLALYTIVMQLGGTFAERAASERAQIMMVTHRSQKELDALDSNAIIRQAEIPIAPTQEVWRALAKALIGLVEAEVFEFTWPLCLQMGQRLDRDVILSVVNSLKTGVA